MGRGEPTEPPEGWPTDIEALDERLRTEGSYATGLEVWEQVGKAYEWYIHGSPSDHPAGLDDAQLWSLKQAVQAQAERGSRVETWIKEWRDAYQKDASPTAWFAIDDLLNDYREHADTGTPLSQVVQGPHPEET